MHCSICCRVVESSIVCVVCSQSSCQSCINLNEKKCCFCNNNIDPVQREIDRQLSLLSITKTHLLGNSQQSATSDRIKQCPVCTVSIEKDEEDCSQIYCTNCHSIWSWNTLAIESNRELVHNPHFFSKPAIPFVACTAKQKLALKSLERLNEEEYRYAVDTYTYRLFLINEIVDANEFRVLIAERYELSLRHDRIAKILTNFLSGECDETDCELALNRYDAALSFGKLPYA
jgi:hypothetical protein